MSKFDVEGYYHCGACNQAFLMKVWIVVRKATGTSDYDLVMCPMCNAVRGVKR